MEISSVITADQGGLRCKAIKLRSGGVPNFQFGKTPVTPNCRQTASLALLKNGIGVTLSLHPPCEPNR